MQIAAALFLGLVYRSLGERYFTAYLASVKTLANEHAARGARDAAERAWYRCLAVASVHA